MSFMRKSRKDMEMKKTPTAILSADWHIRGDKPVCRTDDYMEAQKRKIDFIFNLSEENDQAPILVAGDVGHRPTWGDDLLRWTLDVLGKDLYNRGNLIVIAGQHDLLNHRLENCYKRGLGILHNECVLTIHEKGLMDRGIALHTFPYGRKIIPMDIHFPKNVAIVHQMVIKSQEDKLWEAQSAWDAKRLLKKFPCYDLIVSGDNHQSFVIEHEGRLLVNAGSLMRMTSNQIEHKPSVYLWYAEDNSVERVYLPIEDDVIDRSHIDDVKDRDERIEGFVTRLKEHQEIGLNYEENLKEFLSKNKVGKLVEEKVWETLNG